MEQLDQVTAARDDGKPFRHRHIGCGCTSKHVCFNTNGVTSLSRSAFLTSCESVGLCVAKRPPKAIEQLSHGRDWLGLVVLNLHGSRGETAGLVFRVVGSEGRPRGLIRYPLPLPLHVLFC